MKKRYVAIGLTTLATLCVIASYWRQNRHVNADETFENTRELSPSEMLEEIAKKEPWAESNRKTITTLRGLAKSDCTITIYEIDPKEVDLPSDPLYFAGHRILRKRKLGNESAAFLSDICEDLHWNTMKVALCYEPRYGISITSEHADYNIVVCAECSRFVIVSPKEAAIMLLIADNQSMARKIIAAMGK